MTTLEPRSLPRPIAFPAMPLEPVGEVVESSTTDFVAQACQLDNAPPFGAFVRATADHDLTVYGVVAHVQTTGIDPGARTIMRGHGTIRDESIYVENPDLPQVLRTTFRVVTVGHRTPGACFQFLPPRPPRLHYSVFVLDDREVHGFLDMGLDYLCTLLGARDAPVDELVAANVRLAASLCPDRPQLTREVGRELAQLLRVDYPRFAAILRRLAPAGRH